jgi:hypothetical protein
VAFRGRGILIIKGELDVAVRDFGWGRLISAFTLGLILSAFGGNAVAQEHYWGDQTCGDCHMRGAETHAINFANYLNHGHKWQLVHTGGTNPPQIPDPVTGELVPLEYPASPEFPNGVPLPALPTGVDWSQIEYIIGNFKEGKGSFVYTNGYRNTGGTSLYSCGKCHTTGYNPAGHQKNHLGVEMPGAVGTWQFENIQCEVCHGAGDTMAIPYAVDRKCQQCHTADLAAPNTGKNKFNPMLGTHGYLSGSHSQGDEFDVSPHSKARNGQMSCVWCHDPHRSVWHDEGGVSYTEKVGADGKKLGVGNMCKGCHEHESMRVRGSMGSLLECVDCHMPDASMSGSGATHLFRISTSATDALHNTSFTNPNPVLGVDYVLTDSKKPDSETNRSYWWNVDQDGNSSLTLDLVCANCHANMTLDQMAESARCIHRMSALIDLSVNGDDGLQTVKKTAKVKVDFSIEAGDMEGKTAELWVISQGPKGWSSWDMKKNTWKAGLRPSNKAYTLPKAYTQNVWNKTLSPGSYTYWVCIYPAGSTDEYVVNVPVYVSKK